MQTLQLILVAKTAVKVNGVETPQYRYETADGKTIVEFHTGPVAWTYSIGLGTNVKGQQVAFEVVSAFLRAALHSLKNTPEADQDQAVSILHVNY